MTERRTMEEAMEAIERVEESIKPFSHFTDAEVFGLPIGQIRLLVSLAKRAVREPSEDDAAKIAGAAMHKLAVKNSEDREIKLSDLTSIDFRHFAHVGLEAVKAFQRSGE